MRHSLELERVEEYMEDFIERGYSDNVSATLAAAAIQARFLCGIEQSLDCMLSNQ